MEHFKKIEVAIERILFWSRWLLAPFYVGLALSIVLLLIKFIEEFLHIAVKAFTATEAEIILGVLALVDLTLTGSLLIIVIFSGYENFVSKIDHSKHEDWPEWMGTIDFHGAQAEVAVLDRRDLGSATAQAVHGGRQGAGPRPVLAGCRSRGVRHLQCAVGVVGPHRRSRQRSS